MAEIIRLKDIRKVYQTGEVSVEALRGVNLTLEEDEFVVILGPSGSGKSTLLNIIGGIDAATDGEMRYGEQNLAGADEKTLTRYRRHTVGFVFQFYNLMPNLTARENVRLATDIALESGGEIAVTDGLRAGDLVVSDPEAYGVTEGAAITEE